MKSHLTPRKVAEKLYQKAVKLSHGKKELTQGTQLIVDLLMGSDLDFEYNRLLQPGSPLISNENLRALINHMLSFTPTLDFDTVDNNEIINSQLTRLQSTLESKDRSELMWMTAVSSVQGLEQFWTNFGLNDLGDYNKIKFLLSTLLNYLSYLVDNMGKKDVATAQRSLVGVLTCLMRADYETVGKFAGLVSLCFQLTLLCIELTSANYPKYRMIRWAMKDSKRLAVPFGFKYVAGSSAIPIDKVSL